MGGYIGGDGTVLSTNGSFKASRIAEGTYEVTFDNAFTKTPAVVVSQVYTQKFGTDHIDPRNNAVVRNISQRKFQYTTGTYQGDTTDRAASFIVLSCD